MKSAMTELKNIQKMTTVINNTHESCYKCYHILDYVLQMVRRGDSKETIAEVVELLNTDTQTLTH